MSQSTPDRASQRLWNFCRQIRHRHAEATRTVLFGLVGLSGMAIDLVTLSLLLPIAGFSTARAAAILLAMTWNFSLNRAVTFQTESRDSIFRQYWRFVVSCSIGAAINWTVSLRLASNVPLCQEHVLLSAVGGVLAGFLLNFQLCRRWVFRKTDHQTVPAETAS